MYDAVNVIVVLFLGIGNVVVNAPGDVDVNVIGRVVFNDVDNSSGKVVVNVVVNDVGAGNVSV